MSLQRPLQRPLNINFYAHVFLLAHTYKPAADAAVANTHTGSVIVHFFIRKFVTTSCT